MATTLAVDFEGPVTDGFRNVATFVPKLFGALIVLAVGYFIAKALSKVVDRLLERVGFDRAVERGGLKQALAKSKFDASDIVAKLVFFGIFITALMIAVGVLGIRALEAPVQSFVQLIPRLIVAVVLVVIGAALATAAKKFSRTRWRGFPTARASASRPPS